MTMIKTQQSPGIVKTQQVPGGMPIITNSMSLRQLKPKSASQVPTFNAKYGGHRAPGPPAPRQMATFIPQTPSTPSTPSTAPSLPMSQASRPVQVRTVFVPPPMKMKATTAPGASPVSPSSANSPKVINSFNLSLQGSVPLASGISITPISKSNGVAPVIKGINANNGLSPNKVIEESYDDIELDDDDEGAEEKNELQIVAAKNLISVGQVLSSQMSKVSVISGRQQWNFQIRKQKNLLKVFLALISLPSQYPQRKLSQKRDHQVMI